MFETLLQQETNSEVDFVRELRLRQWARQNFVLPEQRKTTWHPIVLDEMRIRDQEMEQMDETNRH